jgi:hypothetical protein
MESFFYLSLIVGPLAYLGYRIATRPRADPSAEYRKALLEANRELLARNRAERPPMPPITDGVMSVAIKRKETIVLVFIQFSEVNKHILSDSRALEIPVDEYKYDRSDEIEDSMQEIYKIKSMSKEKKDQWRRETVELYSEPIKITLGQMLADPYKRGFESQHEAIEYIEKLKTQILPKMKKIIEANSRPDVETLDRLVLIEPNAAFPLALNPLDIQNADINHTIALLEYVFGSLLDAKFTPLQLTLFRNVLPAIVQGFPNPTLSTFRDIVENGIRGYQGYFDNLEPHYRRFFATQFDTKTYTDTRNQLIWRLDYLMTNQLMREMFSAPKTKLDIGKEMDAGKVIIINNSKALLDEDGAEFFGRFFIALILAAAQQRAGRNASEKKPVFCYVDECHNVIKRDEKISTILDECRSQKIALILAHQRTEQITSKNVLSALANCASGMRTVTRRLRS